MTAHSSFPELSLINKLSGDASLMGYEIVDLAGFLDLVDSQAQAQRAALMELGRAADSVQTANTAANGAAQDLTVSVTRTYEDVHASVEVMRDMGQNTRDVAAWVQDLSGRTASVSDTLMAVKKNNSQIDAIAMQVNTLAINAKIEAARAGEAGRGFAVVAEAINELSRQTKEAAEQISTNIEDLTSWITKLSDETKTVSRQAASVLTSADATDEALGRMQTAVDNTRNEAERINVQTDAVAQAMLVFEPCRTQLTQAVTTTSEGISEAHGRIERLIDTSEAIVQTSAALGGTSDDAPFIEYAKSCGQALGDALTEAVKTGQIQDAALFSRTYSPIRGSNPEQKMAPFTDLFDRVLPPIQEPALDFDPKVVFCAAVDQNGYLPTHNKKFSQPQGNDPVWNMANCRNRRIFDDRVGLKAGRNIEPFLLQVYRRDMGGGVFKMMKDLSVPIMVNGRHWGGLRLAYTF